MLLKSFYKFFLWPVRLEMGGGGSSGPSNTTVTNTNLPDYAAPYFSELMKQGAAQSGAQYTPYAGQQVADASPFQQQSYDMIGGMQMPGSMDTAGQIGTDVANKAMNWDPNVQANQVNYNGYNAAQSNFNTSAQQAPQMQQANQVSSQNWTDPGVAQSYMSPYVNQVVNNQLDQSNRQFGIQQNHRDASAAAGGALGGYRQALENSEAQRNQNFNNNNIVAQGYNTAYGQGQQTFGADQSRNLQGQMSNQSSQNLAGQQNLGAQLSTQNLGQQLGLQQSLANQGALNQAGQYNAGQDLQAQGMNNQYGIQAAGMNNQYGLQALGQAATQGNNLAQLGGQQQSMALNQANAMNQMGVQQQNQQQTNLNQAYSNYQNQLNWNRNQLSWLGGLIHGNVPTTPNSLTSTYQPAPSGLSAGIGAGIGALGLSQAVGGG
jgi:hypothetical protein